VPEVINGIGGTASIMKERQSSTKTIFVPIAQVTGKSFMVVPFKKIWVLTFRRFLMTIIGICWRNQTRRPPMINIIKTIGVIVFLCIAWPIYAVLCVYDSVKHPERDDIEGFCPTQA
jgi:hypothetical protein